MVFRQESKHLTIYQILFHTEYIYYYIITMAKGFVPRMRILRAPAPPLRRLPGHNERGALDIGSLRHHRELS
jgi:hypothetical protein